MRPIPKKSNPSVLNDYRPIALTSVVMKCFERLILSRLLKETCKHLDPLQFAYRHNRSTEDAVITMLNYVLEHLQERGSYVRILFADLSSAFNTIKPHLLAKKMKDLGVSREIILWILVFLTNRRQCVRIGDVTSSWTQTSTGAPQGCVLSAFLFILYTNDCRSTNDLLKLIKFSDDSAIVDTSGSDLDYKTAVNNFSNWCTDHFLQLNVSKTKEMVIDFRRTSQPPDPITIDGEVVDRVEVFKYLGIQIDSKLCFADHVDFICKKAQSRLHLLRKLRWFGVSNKNLKLFYSCFIESLLTFSFVAWYGSLSIRLACRLSKLVHISEKIVGYKLRSLDTIYKERVLFRARKIKEDETHVLAALFKELPSGRRLKASAVRTDRFGRSFVPTAIRLLNTEQSRV